MDIDLRKCVRGQKLKSKHGLILIYIRPLFGEAFDHEIQYPNGAMGTRIHDGHTYRNPEKRRPEDHDIVEILPLD